MSNHQIQVRLEDTHKAAFETHGDHFEYLFSYLYHLHVPWIRFPRHVYGEHTLLREVKFTWMIFMSRGLQLFLTLWLMLL